ncbi:MAG: class I SAM-dependent methyltransferase [Desulfuromonadaceae bacterium]
MTIHLTGKFVSWEEAVNWLKFQPEQQELVRACFYDDPLTAAAERYYASTEWRAVQKLIENCQKGRALDIGAGRGISSYALARDGWSVSALEPDPSPVVGAAAIRVLAADNILDISTVESWGEQLPFSDNSFELVYARQVLHHAHNLMELCREIFRVLKPGGTLLATREHVISRPEDLDAFLAGHPLHGLYGGEHAYLLADYRAAISASGLTLTQTLATYSSDINLYPVTVAGLREKVEKKLSLALPEAVFRKFLIPMLNLLHGEPGRLYTFLGQKP